MDKFGLQKDYIGFKRVSASMMTAEEAEKNGYRVADKRGDGVEVTYDDGYKSWCPLDVFLKNNQPVRNEVLAESAPLMFSSDYKERFKAEYLQVSNRYDNLEHMLNLWDEGKLAFTPTCPRAVYNFQMKAMKEYLDTLIIRAKIEGIEL